MYLAINPMWLSCVKEHFPIEMQEHAKPREHGFADIIVFYLPQCGFTRGQKYAKSSGSLHRWLSSRLRGEDCKLLRRERPSRWLALSDAVSLWHRQVLYFLVQRPKVHVVKLTTDARQNDNLKRTPTGSTRRD